MQKIIQLFIIGLVLNTFAVQQSLAFSYFKEANIETSKSAIYYVSKNGDDNNPGTKQQPFKTLKKASTIVKAGDVCYVYGGIYREILKTKNNGTANKPILFKAVEGEKVIISALDELSSPSVENNTYIYNLGFNFTTENFVLCDGEPLNLARWPNKNNNKLLDPEAAAIVNKGSSPTGIVNYEFPSNFSTKNLKGATIWANAECKWSCWTSHVVGFDKEGSKILLKGFGDSWWINERHNPARAHKHYGDGIFYVAGAEILLDAPGEWFFHKEKKQLKVKFPKNKSQENAIISISKRAFTVDFRNRSFIEIEGIHMVGAPVSFQNASNCSIKNGVIKHFYYSFGKNSTMGVDHNSGILLGGKNNSIYSTEIYGSAGSGILITGTNNQVINCDIHDVNFLGSHAGAPISLKGKGHLISHNSIHETGRVCISMGGGAHTIQYNHIYNPGRNSEDLGVIKCGGTDADNIHIHHNKINNDNGKFIGIYFDNYSNNLIAHHNIVEGMKDGIRSNRPGQYHIIYNNTVFPDINNKYGPWEGPLDQFGSVIVNNDTELKVMANAEVIKFNNIHKQKTRRPAPERKNLYDFPDYIGALDKTKTPFKTGHDFENPPKKIKKLALPFIRNHVKNGGFDYATTYSKTTGKDKDKLAHWSTTDSKNIAILHFPGFNFPTNPEDRFSIHGHSLELSGNRMTGVQQKLTTLKASRSYKLGAYVKSTNATNVQFQITQKGKVIAEIETKDIKLSNKSNWKFVQLEFKLTKRIKDLELRIHQLDKGKVYVDNIGILPLPIIEKK